MYPSVAVAPRVSNDFFADFGWKRVMSRTATMVAVVFVAETVPRFGVVLDLVGGSTITLMTMILPGVFNLYLCVGREKAQGRINTDHRATLREYVLKLIL